VGKLSRNSGKLYTVKVVFNRISNQVCGVSRVNISNKLNIKIKYAVWHYWKGPLIKLNYFLIHTGFHSSTFIFEVIKSYGPPNQVNVFVMYFKCGISISGNKSRYFQIS